MASTMGVSKALSDLEVGIRINGQYLNNIHYVDDTVLLATNVSHLPCLPDRVKSFRRNIRKTNTS